MLTPTEQAKCSELSEMLIYNLGGHNVMLHKNIFWNNLDKCEPQQKYIYGPQPEKMYLRTIFKYKKNKVILNVQCFLSLLVFI